MSDSAVVASSFAALRLLCAPKPHEERVGKAFGRQVRDIERPVPATTPSLIEKFSIDLPVWSEGWGDCDWWPAVSAESLDTYALQKLKEDVAGSNLQRQSRKPFRASVRSTFLVPASRGLTKSSLPSSFRPCPGRRAP